MRRHRWLHRNPHRRPACSWCRDTIAARNLAWYITWLGTNR